jgi:cation diffusion facilitator CzcD-associated flavoprotein CzcO
VPEVAKVAKQLTVFQRSAHWVLPRPDRVFDSRAQTLFAKVPQAQRALRNTIYTALEAFALGYLKAPSLNKGREWQSRQHLEAQVQDPELRRKLTPNFRLGCKRVLFSSNYYPTLTERHVELVTESLRAFTPAGIRTQDGKEREFDVVVCATGFEAAEAKPPFVITGRSGKALTEAWADGIHAYLGSTIPGFPNFFMIEGPNTGLGHSSMIYMIESQVAYIVSALQALSALPAKGAFDVRTDIEQSYNNWLQEKLKTTVWATGCKSWYLTADGRNTTVWPGFTFEFKQRTARFDRESYEVV